MPPAMKTAEIMESKDDAQSYSRRQSNPSLANAANGSSNTTVRQPKRAVSLPNGTRRLSVDFTNLLNSECFSVLNTNPANLAQEEDDDVQELTKPRPRNLAEKQAGGRNSFRRRRFSRALSGFSIEAGMRSLIARGSSKRLTSKDADERAELLDSVRWLGRHIGESVFSSLIEQTRDEGTKFKEQLDASMSSFEKFTPEEIMSGKKCKKLGIVEERQIQLLNSISSMHYDIDDSSSSSSDDSLPPAVKHHSALLFVDISGFTKLSTSLGVELLSKVSFGIHTHFVSFIQLSPYPIHTLDHQSLFPNDRERS
jgi:hypothetical protein